MKTDQYEALSFDCYGTLIDWESGILTAVRPVLSFHRIDLSEVQILELYAQLESEAEAGEYVKCREILRKVIQGFGQKLGFVPISAELDCLANSLKDWQPFPDTVEALQALKKSFRLAVISNVDLDLFAESLKYPKVAFDFIIPAERIKSYKPALRNFEFAIERIGVPPHKILHIGQSVYHDIIPAKQMGLSTVWVNRRKGKRGFGATPKASARPDFEVADLGSLVSMICGDSQTSVSGEI